MRVSPWSCEEGPGGPASGEPESSPTGRLSARAPSLPPTPHQPHQKSHCRKAVPSSHSPRCPYNLSPPLAPPRTRERTLCRPRHRAEGRRRVSAPRQVHLWPHRRLWGQTDRGEGEARRAGPAPHTGEPRLGVGPAASRQVRSLSSANTAWAAECPLEMGRAAPSGPEPQPPSKGLRSWWSGAGRGRCTQSVVRGCGGPGVLPGNRGAGGAGNGAETSQERQTGPSHRVTGPSFCSTAPAPVGGVGLDLVGSISSPLSLGMLPAAEAAWSTESLVLNPTLPPRAPAGWNLASSGRPTFAQRLRHSFPASALCANVPDGAPSASYLHSISLHLSWSLNATPPRHSVNNVHSALQSTAASTPPGDIPPSTF